MLRLWPSDGLTAWSAKSPVLTRLTMVRMRLARLPVGHWIGMKADSHWAADGIAVGTPTLFDRSGAFDPR